SRGSAVASARSRGRVRGRAADHRSRTNARADVPTILRVGGGAVCRARRGCAAAPECQTHPLSPAVDRQIEILGNAPRVLAALAFGGRTVDELLERRP